MFDKKQFLLLDNSLICGTVKPSWNKGFKKDSKVFSLYLDSASFSIGLNLDLALTSLRLCLNKSWLILVLDLMVVFTTALHLESYDPLSIQK